MEHDDPLVEELFKALGRLAAPAADQIAYLQRLGTAPSADELALELDDVVFLLPKLLDEGRITWQQADLTRTIERKLLAMSGEQRSHLWTVEALVTAEEWEDVRRLAAAALAYGP